MMANFTLNKQIMAKIRDVSQEEYAKTYRHMKDNREEVEVGDTCFGFWWGNDCAIFVADKLTKDVTEDEAGIGYRNVEDGDVADIAGAYHVVVLEKAKR